MKKQLIILFTCTMLLNNLNLLAQETPEKMIDTFFKYLQAKENDKAIEYIYQTNALMKNDDGFLSSVKNNFKITVVNEGELKGYEQIKEEKTGNSIIKMTFIAKYQNSPITIIFVYYKPEDKWTLYNIIFEKYTIEEEKNMRRLPPALLRRPQQINQNANGGNNNEPLNKPKTIQKENPNPTLNR